MNQAANKSIDLSRETDSDVKIINEMIALADQLRVIYQSGSNHHKAELLYQLAWEFKDGIQGSLKSLPEGVIPINFKELTTQILDVLNIANYELRDMVEGMYLAEFEEMSSFLIKLFERISRKGLSIEYSNWEKKGIKLKIKFPNHKKEIELDTSDLTRLSNKNYSISQSTAKGTIQVYFPHFKAS